MASNDSYDSGGLWITTKFAHLSCPYINCEQGVVQSNFYFLLKNIQAIGQTN